MSRQSTNIRLNLTNNIPVDAVAVSPDMVCQKFVKNKKLLTLQWVDEAVCGYQIKEEEKKIRGVSWNKKIQTNRDCTRAINVVIAPANSKKKKQ